jgi:hypothetical protein
VARFLDHGDQAPIAGLVAANLAGILLGHISADTATFGLGEGAVDGARQGGAGGIAQYVKR